MHQMRRLVLANRPIACMVIALALLMKILVPAGFMPTISDGQVVVSMCSGMGPKTMVITIPGVEQKSDIGSHQGTMEKPCAFVGLSASSLSAAGPLLLATAILFVLTQGTRPQVRPAAAAPPYLRPPLRAPPLN